MSRVCELSGKKSLVGNRVSHAKNRTKVRLMPNIQNKKFVSPTLGTIKLRLSTKAIRTISKIGLEAYCAKVGKSLS